MKIHLSGLAILTFLWGAALAQKNEKINSAELIQKGIKLHEDGKYKEAVSYYQQVPRNDTNFVLALYEKAYSQSLDSNYAEAIKSCIEGLDQDNDEYELMFLSLKASIVDDSGNSEKAATLYDSILAKYPNALNVQLNKAVTLMRMKKQNEAEALIQDLLVKNPFYASAHFRLAQLALQRGQLVPAMMALYTYLINNPSGPYSATVIKLLDNMSKATDDVTELISGRKQQPEGNFAMVEQIVLSRIALDKNYKVLTDLDDPIIRQLQVMMEKLEYDSDSKDFYMQFYVPYLKDIFNKKLFEPAVFEAFSDVKIEKIQRYLKKNEREVKNAVSVIAMNLERIRSTRELNYTKRQTLEPLYHFDDNKLFAKGTLKNEKPFGKWEFYYDNGNIKSIGQFSDEGKKEGKWIYYYPNGRISGYDTWRNGVQIGEDLVYNKQGVLVTKGNFRDGKLQGEKITYFSVGHPYTSSTYVDGKETGKYIEYFSSGRKKIEAGTSEDALQGSYRTFHENGKPDIVANYEKGKLTGSYKSYYDNGQLEFEANYKDGEADGPVKTYHRNGKIKRTATYSGGIIEGEEVQYNDEGVVIQKIQYRKGKAEGEAKYFDFDGKLYSTLEFDNDKLKAAKYFDKNGKEISSASRQNRQIDLTTFTPEGFKNSHAVYNDKGEKQNMDTYFYPSGAVKETNSYEDGMLEGVSTGYFPNGKKEYEISYSKDKKNGLSRYYYQNGQLKSEGWYDDGKLNGDWTEYNEKGKITSLTTYMDDDVYGTSQTFFANGVKDDETINKLGWVAALRQFDTLGSLIFESRLVNGNGNYKGIYFNGKTRFEGKYVNGEPHGVYTNYYFDGSNFSIKSYDHGLLDGDYTEYHYGGKVSTQGKYSLGKKTGTWKYFYPDGTLSREEIYQDGNLNGKSTYYFPNGKIEREINYKDDERDGAYTRYSADGQLYSIFYYRENVPVGYTYNDKNGQLIPRVNIPGGNATIVTYFSNGNKSSEMRFADGKLKGSYKLYFPNGKMYYEEENLENGETVGKLREYYASGTLKSEYNYYYDNQDGPYKEFYENGKVKEEGNFYNGYLNGTRKYYDAAGKLIEKREYYYGILLNVTK